MKKIVSLVATLTLVLAMGLNVCAAPSVSAQVKVAAATNAKDVAVVAAPAAVKNEATNVLASVASVKAADFSAVATLEVSGTIEAGKTATIKFEVPGVKATDTVVVLHKAASGWEKVPATAANGSISAEFTSFSPVVIFVKAGAASPKTADASLTTAACVAMLAVAGLVISKKKFA